MLFKWSLYLKSCKIFSTYYILFSPIIFHLICYFTHTVLFLHIISSFHPSFHSVTSHWTALCRIALSHVVLFCVFWWDLAGWNRSQCGCCTEYLLAIATVPSRLLQSSIVCLEDTEFCLQTLHQVVVKLEKNKLETDCTPMWWKLCDTAILKRWSFYFDGEWSPFPVWVTLFAVSELLSEQLAIVCRQVGRNVYFLVTDFT